MKLSEEEIRTVLQMVQKEPRTVQEIAQTIDRSWVTTEKYLQELQSHTGQISLKTFREGTQAALKIVYYVPNEVSAGDEIKQGLQRQILTSKFKEQFDFMDLFQFVPENKKKVFTQQTFPQLNDAWRMEPWLRAEKQALYFSGNMSFMRYTAAQETLEKVLNRGVHVKILARVNVSSLTNLEIISSLLVKYPHQIEIRHRYHPLRGMVIDDRYARFKMVEEPTQFRLGELPERITAYCELTDQEWIKWLESIFWSMWRSSIDYQTRIKEIQKIIGNNAGEYYASKAKAD